MNSGLLHQEIEGLSFPIIISDYVMPKMDGITFNEKVHKEFPQIPIILLTALEPKKQLKVRLSLEFFKSSRSHLIFLT